MVIMLWRARLQLYFYGDIVKSMKYSYNFLLNNYSRRKFSTQYPMGFSSNTILISDSRDIYRNLALEDWVYKNVDLSSKNTFILLMWFNHPAVVIGRHQNPWIECSLDVANANGINIARRNSGGGTVYHDFGNLNSCFFSPRKKYNRQENLNLVCSALMKKWPLNLAISKREDIVIDSQYKISGTASKLGRTTAYHHCTVLVNVDQIMLHQVLHRELDGIESRATSSVKSEVKNLKSVCPDITVSSVTEEIRKQYKNVYRVSEEHILNVDPTEEMFPGLSQIEDQLKSWDWTFGRTPRFHVKKFFPLCPSFSRWSQKNLPHGINIEVTIKNGLFENISIAPEVLEPNILAVLQNCLNEEPFSASSVETCLDNWLMFASHDIILCKYIKTCILQSIQDVYR